MTFKHTNFEDSETMRSLVKLAKEKGLVKEDPLKKIASKKPKLDLRPTDNLSENLMKLCSGLRASGMEKYAEELESTFLQYKQAAASECDNDLIQQAHPKGSYKLEGVEGDALIETIIDEHLRMMKMVEKMPTGKLTNAKSIINAVKISLGEEKDYDAEIQAKSSIIEANLKKAKTIMISFIQTVNEELTIGVGSNFLNQIEKVIANPTIKGMSQAKFMLSAIRTRIKPRSYIIPIPGVPTGVTEKTWRIVQNTPITASNYINNAMAALNESIQLEREKYEKNINPDLAEEAKEKSEPESEDKRTEKMIIFENEIQKAQSLVNATIAQIKTDSVITKEERTKAFGWLQSQAANINAIKEAYNGLLDKEPAIAGLQINLNTIVEKLNKFRQGWV